MPKPEPIICGGRQSWALHFQDVGWICTCCRRPIRLRLVETPPNPLRGGKPFAPYAVTSVDAS